MFTPVDPDTGARSLEKEFDSIGAAKRRSRELMKQKQTIVTRE